MQVPLCPSPTAGRMQDPGGGGLQEDPGVGVEGEGLTMVSSPRVRSIRKKMMAQNGERGSLVKASG